MPAKKEDLPGAIKRSPKKAQRTFEKTLDSALETYDGDEEAAHRTAYSALKHSYEKVGDHWEEKDEKGRRTHGRSRAGQRRRARRSAASTSGTRRKSCTSGPASSGSRDARR